jgi:hypothetical protein
MRKSSASSEVGENSDIQRIQFPCSDFLSSKLGCIGSLLISVIGTLLLIFLMRGCTG